MVRVVELATLMQDYFVADVSRKFHVSLMAVKSDLDVKADREDLAL